MASLNEVALKIRENKIDPEGPGRRWKGQSYDILAALSGTGAGRTAGTLRTVFVPPRSENLGYDSAGDLHTTSRWTFGWNELGQLTTITETAPFNPATATQINCTCDVQGHRVQKQVSVGGKVTKRTTTFWDGWRPAMETDYIGTSSTISAQRWYTWGPDVSGSPSNHTAAGSPFLMALARFSSSA